MKVVPYTPRPDKTLWLNADTGIGYVDGNSTAGNLDTGGERVPLSRVLAVADRAECTRVMLTGGVIPRHWFLERVEGWTHGRHHLDHETPTGRYARAGREVEVRRAAEWFGEVDSPRDARTAWQALGRVLDNGKGGAAVFRSPGATGLDLWLRTAQAEVPEPLDADTQELIRSTSPQHRIELHAPRAAVVPGVWVMDGRWMYAALTNGLGSGPATMLTGDAAAMHYYANPYSRARYRVRFTAPEWWEEAHLPGVLMARAGESVTDGWHCPTHGETWADAAEVHTAIAYEWEVTFLEGMIFTPGRPLDTWTTRLVRARESVSDDELGADVARLVRSAVRATMLHSIGSWHSSGADEVTVTASTMHAPDGDGWDAPERLDNGQALWRRRTDTTNARRLSMRHPEWSSQVWGRAHARMLETPTGVKGAPPAGMLNVPRDSLMAVYGDALMLAARPTWADTDDGKPGRLRVKGHLCGPIEWPTTARERDQLTHAAEAAGTTCNKGCP